MRLTLRTMLAYLDDILEPDDTEDIGRKIEESDFATNLMHRTRDCMRRLRLGVPPLVGRGLAADPNSVAEYLDNKLSSDRVPEFEKVCLESDVHLAEVAACHQILTLVLGEPAEIDAASRQRMYRLAAQVDAPPVQAEAVAPVAAMPGAPPVQQNTRRAKPEVPDYLRESRSRLWPVAAIVALAALLTFAILVAVGPSSLREQLTALVTRPAENADAADGQPAEGDTAKAQNSADDAAKDAPSKDAAENAAAVGAAAGGANEEEKDNGTGARAAEPAADEMPVEDAADATLEIDGAEMPKKDEPAADSATPGSPLENTTPSGLPPAPPIPGLEERPVGAEKPADMPADGAEKPVGDATATPGARPPATDDAAPVDDAADESTALGRYLSNSELLLKLDPATENWKRLPATSTLTKGSQFISLPAFRPTVQLSSNITVQADGAAQFGLLGATAEGVPVIDVGTGRLLMITTSGKAGNSVVLKLENREALVTFVDTNSDLAVEVRRTLTPGKDPQENPAPVTAEVYSKSGLIRIRDGERTVELPAPSRWVLFSAAKPETGGEFPKWVTSETISDLDRAARKTIEPMLLPDKPAGLVLKELSVHRRREVRSLAIRDSCFLGNFDACVQGLNDKEEKNVWPSYIEELRTAIARSPEMAAKVHAALEKQRGADGELLYRMLWGYNAEDLKNGADRDLVDALNHEALDVRVVAFWDLQNITGLPTSGYRPADPEKQRRTAINGWKEKLRQGKIVPKTSAPTRGRPKAADKDKEKDAA